GPRGRVGCGGPWPPPRRGVRRPEATPKPGPELAGAAVLPVGRRPVGQPQHPGGEGRRPDQLPGDRPHAVGDPRPAGHRYGLTQNQYSSTRPRAVRAWASSPAPETSSSPCRSLMAGTLSARSPLSRVAFHSSGSDRLREATYLGMLLIRG